MKKGKLVKLLSVMSMGALLVGMLAGCGSSAPSTTTPAATETVETASADTEAAETPAADTTSDSDTIIMGTNAEFEPFEYRDGMDITGFDVEIAQAVADKLGKKLQIEDMEFDSLIMALNSDKIDFIAAGMTATDERRTQVDFSDSYFTSNQVIIVKADNTDITTADDLAGKKVGVQTGTTGDLFVSGTEGIEDISRFNKATLAVMDLKNDKVDAVVIDEEPAKKMTDGQSDLKILEAPFTKEEYAIAVQKGDAETLEAVNATIEEMKSNGKYDEIYAKYFGTAE